MKLFAKTQLSSTMTATRNTGSPCSRVFPLHRLRSIMILLCGTAISVLTCANSQTKMPHCLHSDDEESEFSLEEHKECKEDKLNVSALETIQGAKNCSTWRPCRFNSSDAMLHHLVPLLSMKNRHFEFESSIQLARELRRTSTLVQ